MNTKIVNLFGGPGVGKSTVASELFCYYKKKHIDVELVTEYAKELTWEERKNILDRDQLYIFAKQHRKISRLIGNVNIIITDSPLLLSSIYFNTTTNIYDQNIFDSFVLNTYNKYNNINILLKRNPLFKYNDIGRNQNLNEAILIDEKIQIFLDNHNQEYHSVIVNSEILENIITHIPC